MGGANVKSSSKGIGRRCAGRVAWVFGGGARPPGGEITALAVDPMKPATLYGGTNEGLVFKTVDGGRSWHVLDVTATGQGSDVLVLEHRAPRCATTTPSAVASWRRQLGQTGRILTFYGASALAFMMVMYALERRHRPFVLAFAHGCGLSSVCGASLGWRAAAEISR